MHIEKLTMSAKMIYIKKWRKLMEICSNVYLISGNSRLFCAINFNTVRFDCCNADKMISLRHLILTITRFIVRVE